MEHKNNKCCDMLLTRGACNSQTGYDAWKYVPCSSRMRKCTIWCK